MSDATFGLRLRYAFSRQLGAYVGVEWNRTFSGTAFQSLVNGGYPVRCWDPVLVLIKRLLSLTHPMCHMVDGLESN
ncbi:copper resistance protein B [Rheinheimera texasensis]|uniref:copper resistance protein B n=1 Tax=Rheinheimera texasensis TaxID=306205 RepID=UPI0032B276AC